MARILHLPVKGIYFNQIKERVKPFEFRLQTRYWIRRLVNQEYAEVHIMLGYPKKGDHDRIEVRPWRGFEVQTIQHDHFGVDPVAVFAIRVN